MDFTLDKLMQYKRTNVVAHMGLPPASFFERLVEIAGCPQNSCMSEAAWDLLVKPLYEKRPTVADGNSKLAEILYEAACAIQKAQSRYAEFEIVREGIDGLTPTKATLEVFIESDEKEKPVMQIGIAGEREIYRNPAALEATDTPPVYFMLSTIGTRI